MKIEIKSSLNVSSGVFETQSSSISELLCELQKKNKTSQDYKFFDIDLHEVYPDCEVLINGKSYRAIANGLHTKLKDGDQIEILPNCDCFSHRKNGLK